jgi:predicted PurR-regulated permease PerM
VASVFSPGLRPDAFAVLRIVDRGLATFIRVQVVQAILVGALIWLGITLSNAAGLTDVQYAVSAATLLGAMQVVPQLGFLLGFLPLLLVLPLSGPTAFVTLIVIYIAANRVGGTAVSSGMSRGVLEVHPALMIPGIVVIGQLGVIPLLAAAPIIAISRDLIRYVHGRLSEPPMPAGVLPGAARRGASASTVAAPTPSVYRDALQPAAQPTLATPAVARPFPAQSSIASAPSSPATEWRPTT